MGESACRQRVGEPPGYWHWHQCHRAAVALFQTTEHPVPLCTQHYRLAHKRGLVQFWPEGTLRALADRPTEGGA